MLRTPIVCCVVLMTCPAIAGCFGNALTPPPNLPEPTVRYNYRYVNHADFRALCFVDVTAAETCSMENSDGSWTIVLRDDVTDDRIVCDIAYEKAHMPPNWWFDPKAETPENAAWMLKRRALDAKLVSR